MEGRSRREISAFAAVVARAMASWKTTMANDQKDIFLGSEGDAWYARNVERLHDARPDIVLSTLEDMKIEPKSVLEIGCSNGYRLEWIRERFGGAGFGIEPSKRAIEDGKRRFPSLTLEVGTADRLPFADGQFDVVIFGFCLYLVDPRLHFRCVAEADRVLGEGGMLVIYDFIEPVPYYNEYAHRAGVRSHKMEFSRLFLASPAYRLLRRNLVPSDGVVAKPDETIGVDVLAKSYATAFAANPYK
jgi:SAM-dependent methyltransferase